MTETSLSAAAPPTITRWTRLAYAYALVWAGVLSYFLLGLPVQLTDSLSVMVDVHDLSLREVLVDYSAHPEFFRPFQFGLSKVVYSLADGDLYAWYRGLHAAQATILVLLFVRLLRPRAPADSAIVAFGLAVLIGVHTFPGTVREAFPINHFMTILICCLLTANLARSRPGWHVDAAAAIVFVFAALTIESGLLVWVVLASLWLTGDRGVSRQGFAAVTALLAGYFVLRFVVLDIGSPGLLVRSSGYGFAVRDPEELQQMFGATPARFYAYNVTTSILSLLFAEPRAGVWSLTRSLIDGEARPSLVINVVASTAATALILSYAWRRRGEWLALRFDGDDRLVVLSLGTLAANAAINFAYTKDVIMSPAGLFFAVAASVAARDLLRRIPSNAALVRTLPIAAFCLLLSTTWALRSAGTLIAMRHQVYNVRSDWAYFDRWAERSSRTFDDPARHALVNRLQADAIARYPTSTPVGRWVTLFDVD